MGGSEAVPRGLDPSRNVCATTLLELETLRWMGLRPGGRAANAGEAADVDRRRTSM